jgi:hypothetical protein
MVQWRGRRNGRNFRLFAACAVLAALAAAAPALAQRGPDDGPDMVLSGQGGEDWQIVCEGRTIFGDPLYGEAGGAAYGIAPAMRFERVGTLFCRIDAGVFAPLTLRLEKRGGEPFCPLTGRRGDGPCATVFRQGERAEFAYEAVP